TLFPLLAAHVPLSPVLFLLRLRRPPRPPLFPYTTLFRSGGPSGAVPGYSDSPLCGPGPNPALGKGPDGHVLETGDPVIVDLVGGDRKSTRLNSSHRTISYAVFCLKKKKIKKTK